MKTPAEIRKEIGDRLKLVREATGLSAKDFCQKHNLNFALYLEHENGDKAIKASYAQSYCKLLNIKLDWLLLGDLANEIGMSLKIIQAKKLRDKRKALYGDKSS